MIWCALGLAVLSAFGLAGGTHLQSSAVAHRTDGSLTVQTMVRTLREPRWLVGLVLLGLGTVCNVAALSMAPVSVIQPMGVLGLAITTVLHCRHVGMRINARTWTALALCTGGAVLFVLSAIRFTDSALRVTAHSAVTVTVILACAVAAVLIGLVLIHGRGRELFLLLGAGVLYGLVAVEMKVITAQIHVLDGAWWQSIGLSNVLGLAIAAALGGWLVQSAYAAGPPELVMSGLTVVDPLVGVVIGLSVLGEAAPDFGVGPALLLLGCALISFQGVRMMVQHHPEVIARREAQAAAAPASPATRETPEV